MTTEYTLVAFIACGGGCVDEVHDRETCPLQGHLRCKITSTPGYMAVRLGRFQLCAQRVETLQKEPPKSEPFSRFQLTLLPDLLVKKHKNNKNSSLGMRAEMSDYGQVGVNYTIDEIAPVCGKFKRAKEMFLEISRKAPKMMEPDVLKFKQFKAEVCELRLVNLGDRNVASVIDKLVTFPTIWRLKLEETEPGYLIEKKKPPPPQRKATTKTRHDPRCCKNRAVHWLCAVMIFALMVLIAILVFVVYQYLEQQSAVFVEKKMLEMLKKQINMRTLNETVKPPARGT